MGIDGVYRSGQLASTTSLHLELFDADLGLWGLILWLARLTCAALAAGALGAYIVGLTDVLSDEQIGLIIAISVGAVGVLILAFAKSVYLRAEVWKPREPLRAL